MLVLNTVGTVMRIMQVKAPIFSGRPTIHSFGELAGWDHTPLLMHDGSELKESRRLYAQEVGTRAANARFENTIYMRAQHFANKLLENTHYEDVSEVIYMWVGFCISCTF
jgi:hypothetical protein